MKFRHMLSTGEQAPDFTVMAHDRSTIRLSELAGKYVVLWFYPEADTPG
jgi:peroxiredoxin Q/BCP